MLDYSRRVLSASFFKIENMVNIVFTREKQFRSAKQKFIPHFTSFNHFAINLPLNMQGRERSEQIENSKHPQGWIFHTACPCYLREMQMTLRFSLTLQANYDRSCYRNEKGRERGKERGRVNG